MIEAKKTSILDEIIAAKKIEVKAAKKDIPLPELERQLEKVPPTRPFAARLCTPGKIALIAEIKRRSPSKGLIRRDFNVSTITRAYTRSGAAAISVLADRVFFGGDPGFVKLARENSHLPVLYKEFIIDPYQLYQARVVGADAVLLIAKILSASRLANFLGLAESLGLEALVETHTAGEIEKAMQAGATMVGINNRDLDTFQTDINTTLRLRQKIADSSTVIVSESGIRHRRDMESLARHGIHAALVGETLMRRPDLESAVAELLGNTPCGEVV